MAQLYAYSKNVLRPRRRNLAVERVQVEVGANGQGEVVGPMWLTLSGPDLRYHLRLTRQEMRGVVREALRALVWQQDLDDPKDI